MKRLLLYLFLFAFISLQAQNAKIDTLKQLLSRDDITDSLRLLSLRNLAFNYMNINMNDEAFITSREGIVLAKKMKKYYTEAYFYHFIGTCHGHLLDFDSSMHYNNKVLQLADEHDNDVLRQWAYGSIANNYNTQGNFIAALHYYMLTLQLSEKNQWPADKNSCLCNIGMMYVGLENYDQARIYFDKCFKSGKENGINNGDGVSYEGMAHVMMAEKKYDSAMLFTQKAIDFFKEQGATFFEEEYNIIADIYLNGYENLTKAEEYADKALADAKADDSPIDAAAAKNIIAEIRFRQGLYEESEKWAKDAIATDTTDIYSYTDFLQTLGNAQIMNGKDKEAIATFEKYSNLINKKANFNYQATLTDMEVRYETQKKELQIEALSKEKHFYLILLFAACALALMIFFVLLYRNRLHRRQKQLIATQVALESETAERSRLAKDLHDGLGGMLSLVKLNLNDINGLNVLDNENVTHFSKALEMLDDSITELRRVAHHIMPESLVKYGLRTALQDFAKAVPDAEFHFFGQENRLDKNMEIVVYRSAHELINNVLKHAQAKHIDIQLVQEEDRISLTVSDNGKGFDVNKETAGMGLKNIKYRISVYSGEMTVISSPENGTEVNIEIPLK